MVDGLAFSSCNPNSTLASIVRGGFDWAIDRDFVSERIISSASLLKQLVLASLNLSFEFFYFLS